MSLASPSRRGRADAADLALFHRSLAGLCRAEVPLSRALRLSGGEVGRGGVAHAAEEMARAVEAGEPFGKAYAAHPDVFSPLLRAVVEAGIAAHDLPSALEDVASHSAWDADATQRIRSALVHPMLTAGAALIVGGAAVALATPTLWGLAELVGDASPAPVAFTALGVLAALLVGLILFAWRGSPLAPGRGLRAPIIGPLRDARARASFASTLALLLKRGLPLPQALELSADSSGEPGIKERILAMARRAKEGESLPDALRAEKAFDPSLLWLAEGAAGGDEAAQALADIAGLLRRRFDRGLDRFQAIARPAAEMVVGLVVLAFAYAYTVPLLRQANEFLRLWST